MITIGGLSLDEAKRVLEYLTALREGPRLPTPREPELAPAPREPELAPAPREPEVTFATLLQRITTERVPAAKIKAALGDKMLPAIATDEAEVQRVYDELFRSN